MPARGDGSRQLRDLASALSSACSSVLAGAPFVLCQRGTLAPVRLTELLATLHCSWQGATRAEAGFGALWPGLWGLSDRCRAGSVSVG